MKKKMFTTKQMVLEGDMETIHYRLNHYIVFLLLGIIPVKIKRVKTEKYYGSYTSIKNRTKEIYDDYINGKINMEDL